MNPNLIRTKEGVWVFKDDTHISRWIEQAGRLDVPVECLDNVKQFIPIGGEVVDAGAFVGDHSVTFCKMVGPSGFVYAFEPNPDAFDALVLNTDEKSNICCINCALSDCEGRVSIERMPNAGGSHVKPGVDVACATLDRYIDLFARLDFIKIDVEGYEPKLLMGAHQVLSRFRPGILIEVNDLALSYHGFVAKDIFFELDKAGYAYKPEPFPQYDMVCTPK